MSLPVVCLWCCLVLPPDLIRYLPPRQNKTGVNLLTTSANLTTQKVGGGAQGHVPTVAATPERWHVRYTRRWCGQSSCSGWARLG